MKIFYRRPLSLILCIMLGAFSLFSKISTPYNYILWSAAGLLLVLTFLKPRIPVKRGLIRSALIAFLISSLLSHLYFNLYYRAYERYEGEVLISGEVTDVTENDYHTYLTVTASINNESFSRYKLYVILDYEEKKNAPEFKIGNKIELTGKISDFTNKNSDFNANSYYLSKGYSAKISESMNISVTGDEKITVASYFKNVRKNVAEFVIENSNEEAGGLLVALLLGEKEYLSPSIELDFKRIGISHILALSGLHLAILALGFGKLFSVFGLAKKPRTVITLAFTVLYMTLTGFPISVVRAGIMLIIASLLYLLANASDSLTNLTVSVFLIVLVSPYSIFDVSLLLSAFATLGIVTLGDLPRTYPKKRGIKNAVLNSLTISLFAISATFLISVLSFNEISLISPVSTLIFSFLIEIFLYFGTFFLLFAKIMPLGNILIFLSNIIKNLAASFSSLNYISVSSDFVFIMLAAIVFTLLFFLFLVLDVKRKRLAVAIVSSVMSLILISGVILTYSTENETRLSYNLTETGDAVLLTEEGEITLIESKTYTSGRIYETLNILKGERITRLDNYILTDYNSKMFSALYKLMSEVKITNIYLPKAKDAEEVKIYKSLVSLKEVFSVNLIIFGEERMDFKGFSFTAPYRDVDTGAYEIIHKNKKYLIASSGIFESGGAYIAFTEILNSDAVIFSRHGKSYNNYNFTYEFENPKVIIIASKEMYIPLQTVAYYKNSGAEVSLTPERYDFIR